MRRKSMIRAAEILSNRQHLSSSEEIFKILRSDHAGIERHIKYDLINLGWEPWSSG